MLASGGILDALTGSRGLLYHMCLSDCQQRPWVPNEKASVGCSQCGRCLLKRMPMPQMEALRFLSLWRACCVLRLHRVPLAVWEGMVLGYDHQEPASVESTSKPTHHCEQATASPGGHRALPPEQQNQLETTCPEVLVHITWVSGNFLIWSARSLGEPVVWSEGQGAHRAAEDHSQLQQSRRENTGLPLVLLVPLLCLEASVKEDALLSW